MARRLEKGGVLEKEKRLRVEVLLAESRRLLDAAEGAEAVAIAAPEDVLGAARYEEVVDMLLFDAKPPRRPDALPGGNGLAFDWGLIAGRTWRRQWMLSGGLTVELLPARSICSVDPMNMSQA